MGEGLKRAFAAAKATRETDCAACGKPLNLLGRYVQLGNDRYHVRCAPKPEPPKRAADG